MLRLSLFLHFFLHVVLALAFAQRVHFQSRSEIHPKVAQDADKCVVSSCSKTGAKTRCTFEGSELTCGAWGDKTSPECPRMCRSVFSPVIGSDGTVYGNSCFLRLASCNSNFKVFGPLPLTRKVCNGRKPIPDSFKDRCCCDFNILCAKRGQLCRVKKRRDGPPKLCKKGMTCVVSVFGANPTGKCARVLTRPKTCGVGRCKRGGPSLACLDPKTGLVTSCKRWADRRQ